MGLFIQDSWMEAFLFLVTLVTIITSYFYNAYQYWARKGVPFIRPRFPVGNSDVLLPKGLSLGLLSKKFYDELKQGGHKFGGVYLVTEPNLVVVDPEYVKDILARDFEHFSDRGFYYNERDDPLTAHLFAIDNPAWKRLRAKLTPTFTSHKMKMMFEQVMRCSVNMRQTIENKSEEDVDVKELLSLYATDVIGSCAFGLEANSFKYPDAEFREVGREILRYSLWRSIKSFFMMNLPNLALKLHITDNKPETQNFFKRIVTETIADRKNNKTRRNDFLQIMLDLTETEDLTLDEISAHIYLFFIAGFETSSTTMAFALFHIAKDLALQKKVRQEIHHILKKYDNQFTYESLFDMKCLDQVFDETLRMYPTLMTLNRKCSKDYILQGTDILIEKGTRVLIPTLGLHMDPEYYPEPTKFDPDRFSEDSKAGRRAFIHLPFGGGPRNCLGYRFGIMQSKIALATILRDFDLSVSGNTKPVELDPYVFFIKTRNPMFLRLERRRDILSS